MRIVWSFIWMKFLSIGKGEWCDEMKDGQKLKLGDAHVTPRNIQEVQASKLGDAQGIPFFINKNIRSSLKTLYFYCFICYVLFLEHLYFLFLVLFCFVCCNKWLDPSILLGEDTLRFHCLEHSSFHSYCSVSVLFC
jgi:hypothetical protein